VRDLRRMGQGEQRDRVAAGLRSLAAGALSLELKPLVGRSPWLRLRIGNWRVLFRVAGDHLWVERVINRADLESAVRTLE
jgi:mRNA-degrading endonuclease RelE of RelBE toxin-antitoxin system